MMFYIQCSSICDYDSTFLCGTEHNINLTPEEKVEGGEDKDILFFFSLHMSIST